ncbi:DUF1853 family protein [Winogradskyella ouciana]|uniref:DUF1853 family protein n=1 Tax=Winogradskyella ouciana TaxID=2608631 RepID=A0A7K1G8U7_9FLAO|nr:DUF1853 family protein [Winogradskyella ouciana]MTE25702.1 DUF1853 family protein [Winogradskyella ouciana]
MKQETLLRYQGFSKTPLLWKESFLFPYKQLHFNLERTTIGESLFKENIRLGKLVEEFTFDQLKQHPNVNWIAENIQIQNGKATTGEIDALFHFNNQPIHLEIAYKFYLYDTLGDYDKPVSYWIGPNRKDSLVYKLNKLENKQFPLLYNPNTKAYIEDYGLKVDDLNQLIYFKAQLFLPYNKRSIPIKPLNTNCVNGYYFPYNTLRSFSRLTFYIPEKLDWLVVPHIDVDWVNYEQAQIEIEQHINQKRSPMVWIRHNKDEIHKCFITWW